jgi:hypothetical protein
MENMIENGGDALDISKLVEENLTNETNVGGGTISTLSNVLSDLINLRENQTGKDDVNQTIEFVQTILQSLDILVGACDGWEDIFNETQRYQTTTNYIM